MSDDAPRSVRDELESLRIDRSRPRKPRSRAPLLLAGAALGLVLLGGAAFVWRSLTRPLPVEVA